MLDSANRPVLSIVYCPALLPRSSATTVSALLPLLTGCTAPLSMRLSDMSPASAEIGVPFRLRSTKKWGGKAVRMMIANTTGRYSKPAR